MTPFFFPDSDGVFRTDRPLGAQPAVSAVVYAATSVGLEAVLAGLPTLRFRPRGRIALDILPCEVKMPTAECDTLCEALARLAPPEAIEAAHVFAPIDERLWREALEAHEQPIECRTA